MQRPRKCLTKFQLLYNQCGAAGSVLALFFWKKAAAKGTTGGERGFRLKEIWCSDVDK